MARPGTKRIAIPTEDEAFFADHPDRMLRIRLPRQREFDSEFRSLGPHQEHRRRVIVARAFGPLARLYGVKLMPIPFLLFADETVEDRDDILRSIFDGIMQQARQEHGL